MAVHGSSAAVPGLRHAGPAHRYADNEANYCATCQTGGRLLADRALSRLLKEDWPKTVDGFDRDE